MMARHAPDGGVDSPSKHWVEISNQWCVCGMSDTIIPRVGMIRNLRGGRRRGDCGRFVRHIVYMWCMDC